MSTCSFAGSVLVNFNMTVCLHVGVRGLFLCACVGTSVCVTGLSVGGDGGVGG